MTDGYMRKIFDPQITLGILPIGLAKLSPKDSKALTKVERALVEIHENVEYSNIILKTSENNVNLYNKRTMRSGSIWLQIFV
jgi:hypothetical protein